MIQNTIRNLSVAIVASSIGKTSANVQLNIRPLDHLATSRLELHREHRNIELRIPYSQLHLSQIHRPTQLSSHSFLEPDPASLSIQNDARSTTNLSRPLGRFRTKHHHHQLPSP